MMLDQLQDRIWEKFFSSHKNPTIDELSKDNVTALHYHDVDPKDGWKINMIKEITDVKFNQLEVENFNNDELEEIMSTLHTS